MLEEPHRNSPILSTLHQLFHGIQRNSVSCQGCGYSSSSLEIFSDISLPIAKVYSVQDALALYYGSEDVQYSCPSCHRHVMAKKQATLVKLPKTLIIHLKRFHSSTHKDCRRVSIPTDLKLGSYIESAESEEHKFTLLGVIVHSGKTCTSGHYYAYIRYGTRWFKIDDMRVTQVQDKFMQHDDQPYLVFYKACPRPYGE